MQENKVLLINAPYIEGYGPIKMAAGRYFPLGLGYIGSVLRRNGFDVRLLDPEAQSLDTKAISGIIAGYRPLAVGISSATPNFVNAARIAAIVKSIGRDIKVVIGGVHASAIPKYVLDSSGDIDFVVIGEGEYTMLELCRSIRDKDLSYEGIRGIAYRDGGGVKFSERRPFIQDVDSLPMPARDLIDARLFYPNLFNSRRRLSVGIITSRGCPFRCYFCASHITMGARYRPHSAMRVFEELSVLIRDYGMRQILFLDDTFTFDRKRVFEICELILKSGIRLDWNCLGRVSDVDPEMLKLMKRAGCFSIAYGVESGDEEVLKAMKKGITVGEARRAFECSNRIGLKTQAFFVFGNKGETMEAIDRTICLAKELRPLISFFNILTPYPGTKAFEDMGIENIEKIRNWEDFVSIGPKASIDLEGLSKKDLVGAVYKANMEFYARPSQLFRIILSLRTFYEFKQYLKGGLALLLQMFAWRRG